MKNTAFHTQYKHFGAFANRKYEELSYPQKSENVRPHSSNSIENATHYSQSSRDNATPSSGTSPLLSYKEVPSSPVLNRDLKTLECLNSRLFAPRTSTYAVYMLC